MAGQPPHGEHAEPREEAHVVSLLNDGVSGACTVMVVDDYAPLRTLCTRSTTPIC